MMRQAKAQAEPEPEPESEGVLPSLLAEKYGDL